ncbi:hypothetical protein MF672_006475 [Actinomadura sp. ATCC 31491]|uniref:Uncharacterized protein n=1 Tax=Actinomadura luzonensis TaxID=2805427 RepID=A0ABT0FM73_9ACTN|nr:hypothetical protein [Actinomadura luzonensis]MCK2213439.1 hypothetical protein [Actinomadura luzonensis]
MTHEVAAEWGLPRTVRRFDLVFAGLFPWLTPLDGEHRALLTRPLPPVAELAAAADASPLARTAPPAPSAAGGRGPSAEAGRLEGWARLLARLLRERVEAEQRDSGYYSLQAPLEAIFPLTAHLMAVHLADHPFPALLPALPVAAATHDLTGLRRTPSPLLDGVRAAMDDWTAAGVVTPATTAGVVTPATTAGVVTPATAPPPVEPGALVTAFWRDDTGVRDDPATAAARFLRRVPPAILARIHDSPPVRLTPLGAYALRRLLLAHNWTTA